MAFLDLTILAFIIYGYMIHARYKSVTLVINRNDIKTIATYECNYYRPRSIRNLIRFDPVYFLCACSNLEKFSPLLKSFIKYTYPILLPRFPRAKIFPDNFRTNVASSLEINAILGIRKVRVTNPRIPKGAGSFKCSRRVFVGEKKL